MAKRGPLSVSDKKVILDLLDDKGVEDFDEGEAASILDRTEKSVENYISELKQLGLTERVVEEDKPSLEQSSQEEEVEDTSSRDIRREHLKQIIVNDKGSTVMTPMGSQYGDEAYKNRSRKQKYGKYEKNVMKIRKSDKK